MPGLVIVPNSARQDRERAAKKKTADCSAVVGVATRVWIETTFEVIGFALVLTLGVFQFGVSTVGELFVPLVVVSAVVTFANLKQADFAHALFNVEGIDLDDVATASGALDFSR